MNAVHQIAEAIEQEFKKHPNVTSITLYKYTQVERPFDYNATIVIGRNVGRTPLRVDFSDTFINFVHASDITDYLENLESSLLDYTRNYHYDNPEEFANFMRILRELL